MAQIALEGVRKVYDDGTVGVEGATFNVADGERVVLVGPSGCGKSTLLRMIAGLEEISEGTLRIGERVVNSLPPGERDIAMVFQSYALYPHMTVAQNMGFALKLRGLSKAEVAKRVNEAAALLELEDLLDRRPAQLSGGQRQRVALGRALVRQPQAFLLDEPLSNLDARLRGTMRAEIARLHRSTGTTMVYVTHDQVEAMTLGQRIVVMERGRIQQIDTPMALYERPANVFVAGFLGSPPMNLLRGKLGKTSGWSLSLPDGSVMPLGIAAIPDDWNGREVTLGIRPEHLQRSNGEGGFTTTVDLVEPIGSEAYANLHFGEQQLVGRFERDEVPEAGDTIRLAPDASHLHFFDAGGGQRLSPT